MVFVCLTFAKSPLRPCGPRLWIPGVPGIPCAQQKAPVLRNVICGVAVQAFVEALGPPHPAPQPNHSGEASSQRSSTARIDPRGFSGGQLVELVQRAAFLGAVVLRQARGGGPSRKAPAAAEILASLPHPDGPPPPGGPRMAPGVAFGANRGTKDDGLIDEIVITNQINNSDSGS